MARVMAVSFEKHGQLHYLDCGDGDYTVGDSVLYPTSGGNEVAQVIWEGEESADTEGIPMCAGMAQPADLKRDEVSRAKRTEGWKAARELIAKHNLDMKVVAVDYIVGRGETSKQYAIYFQAPERVDFRHLLLDLARSLHARIDLRQVGARDATRLTGGIGLCGRNLCCSSFLNEFEPVSMRVTRLQGVPSNPLQISGACGKLLCCLHYEVKTYEDFFDRAPAVGDEVNTNCGAGKVIGHSVPLDLVVVRKKSGEVLQCPLAEVSRPKLKLRRRKPRVQTHDEEQEQ